MNFHPIQKLFLPFSTCYRSVTTKFKVRKATAWRAIHRVVKAICEHRNYFICWPSHEEAISTCNRIQA